MSVLKTIRGAFDNVQHDISESFKSITAKTAKSKQTKTPLKIDGVDLDAGADLLNKFQEQWEHIHSESEANAKKAQEVDIRVSGLFVSCEHQNESLNHLVTLVAGLPQLLNEINQVSRKLELLEEEFRHVSDGISELENLNEEIDIAENKNHHKQQLQMYKERKNQELEQAKGSKFEERREVSLQKGLVRSEEKITFAEEHARKARGYEAKLQEKIQERQQVFEDAFKEEIENYKRHGKTQMKPQLTNTVAEDLADITIEEDKDKGVLDEFLKSDDLDAPSNTQKEVRDIAEEELTSEDEADDSPKLYVVADEDIEEENIPVKQEDGAAEINTDIANSDPAERSQGEHFEHKDT